MQKLLATGCVLALLAGCSIPVTGPAADRPVRATASDRATVPAYRFITGTRRSALSSEAFLGLFASQWLPALATHQGPEGLVAYFSALPPAGDPRLPDEVALAAYESEAAADRAWSSQALDPVAATLFDARRTIRSRVSPLPPALAAGEAYDVLQTAADWRGGFTTCFIGARHAEVPPAAFAQALAGQVQRERQAFLGQGLRAYVFMVTPDHKLSFMQWTDMKAFGRAMESPEGKAVVVESQALMRTVQFASARDLRLPLAPGQVIRLDPAGAAGTPDR